MDSQRPPWTPSDQRQSTSHLPTGDVFGPMLGPTPGGSNRDPELDMEGVPPTKPFFLSVFDVPTSPTYPFPHDDYQRQAYEAPDIFLEHPTHESSHAESSTSAIRPSIRPDSSLLHALEPVRKKRKEGQALEPPDREPSPSASSTKSTSSSTSTTPRTRQRRGPPRPPSWKSSMHVFSVDDPNYVYAYGNDPPQTDQNLMTPSLDLETKMSILDTRLRKVERFIEWMQQHHPMLSPPVAQ